MFSPFPLSPEAALIVFGLLTIVFGFLAMKMKGRRRVVPILLFLASLYNATQGAGHLIESAGIGM